MLATGGTIMATARAEPMREKTRRAAVRPRVRFGEEERWCGSLARQGCAYKGLVAVHCG